MTSNAGSDKNVGRRGGTNIRCDRLRIRHLRPGLLGPGNVRRGVGTTSLARPSVWLSLRSVSSLPLATSERVSNGLVNQTYSHYTTFALLIPVGCGLTLLSAWTMRHTRRTPQRFLRAPERRLRRDGQVWAEPKSQHSGGQSLKDCEFFGSILRTTVCPSCGTPDHGEGMGIAEIEP